LLKKIVMNWRSIKNYREKEKRGKHGCGIVLPLLRLTNFHLIQNDQLARLAEEEHLAREESDHQLDQEQTAWEESDRRRQESDFQLEEERAARDRKLEESRRLLWAAQDQLKLMH
jgi:hypothetical protein